MEHAADDPKRTRTRQIWFTLIAIGVLLELVFFFSAYAGKGARSGNAARPPSWYEQKHGLFIPSGAPVKGLFHHVEGSADIFEYLLVPAHQPSWSALATAAAEEEGWRVVKRSDRMVRLTHRWKSGYMEWHAEVRLAHDPTRGVVTVGYCPGSAELLPDKQFVPQFWQTFEEFAQRRR